MLDSDDHPKFYRFQLGCENTVPPSSFQLQDNRFDPLVGVTLKALEGLLSDDQNSGTELHTAIFSVTDTGCASHVKRVIEALVKMRPRQAFFARGSSVMFSTYGSFAIRSHGPCISLSGKAPAVTMALNLANNFLCEDSFRRAILLFADNINGVLTASAVSFTSLCLSELERMLEFSLQFAKIDEYSESIIQEFFSCKGSI